MSDDAETIPDEELPGETLWSIHVKATVAGREGEVTISYPIGTAVAPTTAEAIGVALVRALGINFEDPAG